MGRIDDEKDWGHNISFILFFAFPFLFIYEQILMIMSM